MPSDLGRFYLCSPCQVMGRGSACWMCGGTLLAFGRTWSTGEHHLPRGAARGPVYEEPPSESPSSSLTDSSADAALPSE